MPYKDKKEQKENLNLKRKLKKQNGICRDCSDPICSRSTIRCEVHLEKTKDGTAKWNKENPEKYKELIKFAKDEKVKNGICISCPYKCCGKNSKCKICILKFLSYKYLGTATRWKELQEKLERQKNLCFHTNYPISFEENNISIDHLIPVSKNKDKKYDIDNLVFCEKSFNFARLDKDLSIFVPYFYEVLKSFVKKYERENNINQ